MSDQGGFAAGWYPDPSGGSGLRWYDGERWTDDFHHDAVSGGAAYGGAQPAITPLAVPAYGAANAPMGYAQGASNRKPWEHFIAVLTEHYGDFSGRARRSEYWWFTLINWLVLTALMFLSAAIAEQLLALVAIWWFATLLPSLAAAVRRLHDTDKAGWMLLIVLLPLGPIVVFIFLLLDSDRQANSYGWPPK